MANGHYPPPPLLARDTSEPSQTDSWHDKFTLSYVFPAYNLLYVIDCASIRIITRARNYYAICAAAAAASNARANYLSTTDIIYIYIITFHIYSAAVINYRLSIYSVYSGFFLFFVANLQN